MTELPSKLEQIINYFSNHKRFAVILAICFFIIGIGKFTNALLIIHSFYNEFFPVRGTVAGKLLSTKRQSGQFYKVNLLLRNPTDKDMIVKAILLELSDITTKSQYRTYIHTIHVSSIR